MPYQYGGASDLLVHLQGYEGEWREEDEDDFVDYEDFEEENVTLLKSEPIKPRWDPDTCSICLCRMGAEDSCVLRCNHRFCADCLSGYVIHQLKNREILKGQVRRIFPVFGEPPLESSPTNNFPS